MNHQAVLFERYPPTTPLLENIVWVLVYASGSALFLYTSVWAAEAYAAYCLISMYLLIPRLVCTHCAYFGQVCHSGQGLIAGVLFPKAEGAMFGSYFRFMGIASPVFLAPLIAGLILSVFQFSWEVLVLTAIFGILALWCTRVVTKKLGCPHCKQHSICPACTRTKDSTGSIVERGSTE